MTRGFVLGAYGLMLGYCALWITTFLRIPNVPVPDPWIMLRAGGAAGAVLLVASLVLAFQLRGTWLVTHLAWLGVTLLGVVAATIAATSCILVGWIFEWEPLGYTAMAILALGGLWIVLRSLWGLICFLFGQPVSPWPLRVPAA